MSTFTLYRFYDADDTLLYVGLTINPGRRMEKHRAMQPWWSEVARIEMEQHPDHATLRAAEREAIETESPLYNNRMSLRPLDSYLTWACDECGKPIPDGEGYITVSYAEIHAYRQWHDEFDERQRIKANGGLISYCISELAGMPDPARWRCLHRSCDPTPDSTDYWIDIERIRTYPRLLEWTAHLLEKTWLQSTSWRSILRRAA
jgi:hypothetical protein